MEDLMISLLLKANDSFWYLLSRQKKKNRGFLGEASGKLLGSGLFHVSEMPLF